MQENKPIKSIWVILWLIIFFPIGIILMWARSNWSKKAKWIVTGVFGGILLLGAIGSATSPNTANTSNTTNNSQNNQSQSTPTPAVTQQMKNDYISFYKQYMAIANKSDKANNKVMDDITATSNGTSGMSTADLYLEASDAHDTQDELKREAVSLQIPDSLSAYKDELQKSDDALFALIYSRSNAMKNMADFLNSNDLAKLKDARNSVQQQQSAMMEAVVSMVSVGTKLGVDTTKIQVGQ